MRWAVVVIALVTLSWAVVAPPKITVANMKIQPVLSPINSLYAIQTLIESAKDTLDVQNQYIMKFNNDDWLQDGNPLALALYRAQQRGVQVRVILENDVDSDNAAQFLKGAGMDVRYLVNSKYCHNKGVIVDGKTVLVSSINWSKTSLTKNREAGVIIYNKNVAQYFQKVFDDDFKTGTTISGSTRTPSTITTEPATAPSHNIPAITALFNVTAFSNPEGAYAYDLIMNSFAGAKKSLHAEMYQLTIASITDQLVRTKIASPKMDMSIIMSSRREGFDHTTEQLETLYDADVNVFSSSNQFSYTHAKFWVIDSRYTFIYSGNWAGTSITGSSYRGTPNREWGVMIDNKCFAAVWEQYFADDRGIASPYKSPLACTDYDKCGICGGSGSACKPKPIFDACGVCLGDGSTCS